MGLIHPDELAAVEANTTSLLSGWSEYTSNAEDTVTITELLADRLISV